MATKMGSLKQYVAKEVVTYTDFNNILAEASANPIIGHNETTGAREDFDVGDPNSGSVGHIITDMYQRFGSTIKTLDSSGSVVHTTDLTSISSIDIPIGGIIWWHKSLSGVPVLPAGWVECNGQVLSDPESLLDGQTMPDINGQAYFVRGSSTSGTTQSSQNLQHTHIQNAHSHTQNPQTISVAESLGTAGGNFGVKVEYSVNFTLNTALASEGNTPTSSDVATNQNSGSSEARPINMSMVSIIRVK